jgi:hypothetical protein
MVSKSSQRDDVLIMLGAIHRRGNEASEVFDGAGAERTYRSADHNGACKRLSIRDDSRHDRLAAVTADDAVVACGRGACNDLNIPGSETLVGLVAFEINGTVNDWSELQIC